MMLHSRLRSLVLSAVTVVISVSVATDPLSHSSAFADAKRYSVPVDNSPQKGPKDAPVTIIEFLDFQ